MMAAIVRNPESIFIVPVINQGGTQERCRLVESGSELRSQSPPTAKANLPHLAERVGVLVREKVRLLRAPATCEDMSEMSALPRVPALTGGAAARGITGMPGRGAKAAARLRPVGPPRARPGRLPAGPAPRAAGLGPGGAEGPLIAS